MKRSEAVTQGAPLVHELDEAVMSALRASAAATLGLIDLRREANLSPTVGADAWEELFATTAALQAGVRSSFAFHTRMGDLKIRMGCRTVANGGGEKNPPDSAEVFSPGYAQAPLRAVA